MIFDCYCVRLRIGLGIFQNDIIRKVMSSQIIDDQKINFKRQRILVVDDEPGITFLLKTKLELAGFEVISASNGKQALEVIKSQGLPNLAIVDILMPEMDGLTFCKHVRDFSDLPIIMLTSVGDEDTIVEAIDSFADDYVLKPFRPRELIARVKRVLDRFASQIFSNDIVIQVDDRLAINFANQKIVVENKDINLTPTENKLLYILFSHTGSTLPSKYLQSRMWVQGAVVGETLRVNIHRLRQKIEIDAKKPFYIRTIKGKGYQFR